MKSTFTWNQRLVRSKGFSIWTWSFSTMSGSKPTSTLNRFRVEEAIGTWKGFCQKKESWLFATIKIAVRTIISYRRKLSSQYSASSSSFW
jgi:hypothetical protein